jgi:Cu2+-exporting ATPase
LAIPASQAAAILTLRRHGILITSQNALLLLPLIRCFVFDKTGTLTNGHFAILQTETFVDGVSAEQCLAIATALEAHATHPIATAFAKPTNNNIDHFTVSDVHEYLHQGIEGIINSTCYRLGSAKWCGFEPATIGKTGKTQVILTSETTTLARFTLGDSLRKEAQQCIQTLQKKGIHCAILSGDTSKHVEHIAHTLGIPDFVNACSPDDKVAHLHNLQKQHGPVAMFGDGINDGPVLTQANLSLTLADASQTARLAADVLLLNNRLTDLILLLETAHKSRWIARQNVAWAFFYNVSILPIAAAGLLSPAAAALGMAVSSLVVTLNALRLFITPPRHTLQHPES